MGTVLGEDRGRGVANALSRRSFLAGAAGTLLATGGGGTLLAGCGGESAGAGGVEEVTFLTIIPLNLSYIGEILADLNGHFKKEGLKVKIQSTRGSAQALQSILQGSALLTRAGSIETVIANADQGASLVNIGNAWHRASISFVSADEDPLAKPEDFQGKKVGIPSEGGTSEITIDVMLGSRDVPRESVHRQVTGFSPGTFSLVEKGRIDGYVIGSVERVIFDQQIPKATILDFDKYVVDGLIYLSSQRALQEDRDLLQAYMNAIRAGMEDAINDQNKDFETVLRQVRRKHEFPELEQDSIAKGVMQQNIDAWFYAGEENFMKVVPEDWQKVYDQLVDIDEVPGGKDPSSWFTNELAK